MRTALLALVLAATPIVALARPVLITPPPPTAPQTARWLLVEGTPELTAGIGLSARLTGSGGADVPVGELGCTRPAGGFYLAADGFKAKAGAAALRLHLDGASFDLPILPAQQGARVEAFGPLPVGLLDALQASHTWRLTYGDQVSATLAAPDPLVMEAFLSVCRKIEGEHGQGG